MTPIHSAYPTAKVIILYALFGGIIGGALVGLVVAVLTAWFDFFTILFTAMAYGFLIGLLPALITGSTLAYGQFYRHKKSLLVAFAIGFLVTMLSAIIFLFFVDALTEQATLSLSLSLLIALVGGISAVLTGLFALPKVEIKIEKFSDSQTVS